MNARQERRAFRTKENTADNQRGVGFFVSSRETAEKVGEID
jgi:hypothetical protein